MGTAIGQGANLSRVRSEDGELFRVIHPGNLAGLGFTGDFPEERLDPLRVEKNIVRTGCILISQLASNFRASVVTPSEDGYVAALNLAVVVLGADIGDPYFIAGMLNTKAVQRRLLRRAGGASTATISLATLREFAFPLPSEDVQNEIGQAFRRIEDARRAMERFRASQSARMEHVALDLWEAASESPHED